MTTVPDDKRRFDRIQELFEAALELTPAARPDFLDTACDGDGELREQVERLLGWETSKEAGLDTPAVRLAPGPVDEPHPERIGEYRILSLLGQGGMGTVYEAEQDEPRRRVALKVLRHGALSPSLLQRFRHEAQVLAHLQHRGIAQIYATGTSRDGGQPYFAMELVRGRRLLDYASENGLDVRSRLELGARICDALHHAHQKGVIHRDLKPANLMIDEADDSGIDGGLPQPKILDFGVARAADAELEITRQTNQGELVGTLQYMSPEQATGSLDGIDTRSDIYAVGVVLYELLTGRLPQDLRGKPIYEAARILRDEEPSRLSSVSKVFRGDVETIVGKALAKLPEERYASAAELAADIRRYLNDEPIVARPPSTIYQLRKFAKRNRVLVGSTLALILVLAGSLLVVSLTLGEVRDKNLEISAQKDVLQARNDEIVAQSAELERRNLEIERQALEVREQRDAAQTQAEIARRVNAFLNDYLLAASDPFVQRDPDLRVRDLLDIASEGLDGRFEDQPAVEAALRRTVGEAYHGLNLFAEAEPHLLRALELDRGLGPPTGETFALLNILGFLYMDLDRLDEARSLVEESARLAGEVLPADHADRMDPHLNLAELAYRSGDLTSAIDLYERALAIGREHHPEEEGTMAALTSLGIVYQRLGRSQEALDLTREAYELHDRILGPEHPNTLTARNNLALSLRALRRFEEADEHFLEILGIRRRTLGDSHSDTGVTLSMYGNSLGMQQRFEEAEPLMLEAMECFERVYGRDHPYSRLNMDLLAKLYSAWGFPDLAQDWIDQLAELDRTTTD